MQSGERASRQSGSQPVRQAGSQAGRRARWLRQSPHMLPGSRDHEKRAQTNLALDHRPFIVSAEKASHGSRSAPFRARVRAFASSDIWPPPAKPARRADIAG